MPPRGKSPSWRNNFPIQSDQKNDYRGRRRFLFPSAERKFVLNPYTGRPIYVDAQVYKRLNQENIFVTNHKRKSPRRSYSPKRSQRSKKS